MSEKSKLQVKEREYYTLKDKFREKEIENEKLRYQIRELNSAKTNDLSERNKKLGEELNALRYSNGKGKETEKT